MSCTCTTNSLKLFVWSLSNLELSFARSTLHNPSNRTFLTVNQRQFTSGTTKFWSATGLSVNDDTFNKEESNDGERKNGSAAASNAMIELSDLTDESIISLMKEPPKSSVNTKPATKKQRKPRAKVKERSSDDILSTQAQSGFTIRRPGARTAEEAKEFRIHYSANPNWDAPVPTRNKSNLQSRDPNLSTRISSDSSRPEKNYTPKSVERTRKDEYVPKQREHWQIDKAALKEKFGGEAWNPRKRLSPDAMEGIRALHAQFPDQYNTTTLAAQFEVSPEAIRRILKSKWRANEEEEEDRKRRWFKRGEKVWERWSELGMKPPKQWRVLGVDRKDGNAPLWDRKKRSGGGIPGVIKGGGIIINRGLKAGDVPDEMEDGGEDDDTRGGSNWV